MKQYQHLVKEERFYIWQALREGKSQQEVAVALGRAPSTISREIKRNQYPQCQLYTYHWAMECWQQRKRRGHKPILHILIPPGSGVLMKTPMACSDSFFLSGRTLEK